MRNSWIGGVQKIHMEGEWKSVGSGKKFRCPLPETLNGGPCVMSASLQERNGNAVSRKGRNSR
jgi:hypothetical protein